MTKYSTLLLLLVCLLTGLSLPAQDDNPMLTIQRDHYASAADLQAALPALREMHKLYRENGVTSPVDTWIFDDNTVEHVWSIDAMSDFDVLEDEYDNARTRIGEQRMNELRKKIKRQKKEFLVGSRVSEFSYYPEDFDPSEVGFIHVMRAEIKTDDMDEFAAIAREAVTNAKANNHQTPFSFEVFPVGDGTRVFEVVEMGRDKADFERREAAAKAYYNGPTFKAWAKKRDRVAKALSVREATRDEQLSIPKPEKANDNFKLVVREYQIAPGRLEDFHQYWKTRSEVSAEYHWDNVEFFAESDDEQTVLLFTNLEDYGDLKRLEAKGARMGFAPKEARDKVNLSRTGIASGAAEYILQSHTDISIRDRDMPKGNTAFELTEYSFPYGKQREVYQLAKDIKAHQEAHDTPESYMIYTYDVGGKTNRLFVVHFGADANDLARRRKETMTAIAGPETDALNERRKSLLRIIRRFSGTTRNDLRYQPEGSSK